MAHSCAPWIIRVRHGLFVCAMAHSCAPWIIRVTKCHDLLMRAMTHPCVRHDSLKCETTMSHRMSCVTCDANLREIGEGARRGVSSPIMTAASVASWPCLYFVRCQTRCGVHVGVCVMMMMIAFMGWGAIACHHHHGLFRICLSISAFCLNEKGWWRTSVLCTHIHEFLYISHLFHFIYFFVISNIWFCMLDVIIGRHTWNGIAKYARTYIRDTHTQAHTQKKKKETVERLERLGKKKN